MFRYAVVMSFLVVGSPVLAQPCDETFDSTFDLIRDAVFDGRGCTSSNCHVGPNPAGGLDLAAADAWENLIDVEATSVPAGSIPGLKRVVPGQKDSSLLWFNLAAGTLPGVWQAPLRAMPIGFDPLSADELEAVRLWIEQGAPKTGTVEGTDELLDACLPEPKPIRIQPLPPPPAGEGLQLAMPPWTLGADSEDEVCFVSYFDVTDQVPEEFRGDSGGTFRYVRNQIRQNPGSHHLIVNLYLGATPITDPSWGAFTCKGGARHGDACDPLDTSSCGDGLCGSEPETSLACIGFGPGDVFVASVPFTGTQESSSSIDFIEGVYGEVPTKGILVWNSHAFNLTSEDSLLEAWLNFEFAESQETPAVGIFNIDSIFKMNAPPFAADQVCSHSQLRPDARVFELTSHMHRRGKKFEIFGAQFSCQGGPNDGEPCSPFGPEVALATADLCAGATCAALEPPELGDCDGDLRVGVQDLIIAVRLALGQDAVSRCASVDTNADAKVSIAELISAVRIALAGDSFVDADDSLVYTSLEYNDPVVARFDPPLEFGSRDESPALRTLTYCAVYDNGMSDPTEVKRQSTSPATPNNVGFGGPCDTPIGCTEGDVGATCAGDTRAERDASCDSSPGAGDGVCDACVLTGGVTTEDEMFVLIGTYFQDR